MSVSVLVPFRGDGGERDRIWAWMRRRWEQTMPDCEFVVCDDGRGGGYHSFNEGRALNNAARKASGDIFVIAESEVAFNSAEIFEAISLAMAHDCWLVPRDYHALTADATQALLMCNPRVNFQLTGEVIERSWFSESVSPIIVVPAHAYWLVGGWEDRYDGWGWTDKVFAAALSTLWKPYERFPGAVYHLAHPRSPARDCNPELTRRYLDAAGDVEAMRAIVAERA